MEEGPSRTACWSHHFLPVCWALCSVSQILIVHYMHLEHSNKSWRNPPAKPSHRLLPKTHACKQNFGYVCPHLKLSVDWFVKKTMWDLETGKYIWHWYSDSKFFFFFFCSLPACFFLLCCFWYLFIYLFTFIFSFFLISPSFCCCCCLFF